MSKDGVSESSYDGFTFLGGRTVVQEEKVPWCKREKRGKGVKTKKGQRECLWWRRRTGERVPRIRGIIRWRRKDIYVKGIEDTEIYYRYTTNEGRYLT